MKSQIQLINLETDTDEYSPFFFDEALISAYYITDENLDNKTVNIIITGMSVTIKRTKELEEYLVARFS